MPQSFYQLDIWKNGYTLVLNVYRITERFPTSERYGLIDQLRRSANAIIANIAESQGRHSFNDKIRVLYQSRGEVFETRSHLKVAEGLGYLPEEEFNSFDHEYEGLLIGLNAYIKYLAKARHLN
ncbi:MAG: four helix bundle protein [Candidatus Kerfeldbacteria bacterium]